MQYTSRKLESCRGEEYREDTVVLRSRVVKNEDAWLEASLKYIVFNKFREFHKFHCAACMLTQWPANCCCRWYKGALPRPVDTWLSPRRRPTLLTATFVWGAQCLWRGLQWELVVITGPLVLSEMLSNQHSHYWVTWHLLLDTASLLPPPPSPLLWMNASLSLSLCVGDRMKHGLHLTCMSSKTMQSSVAVWVWGGKRLWVGKCVSQSEQNIVV